MPHMPSLVWLWCWVGAWVLSWQLSLSHVRSWLLLTHAAVLADQMFIGVTILMFAEERSRHLFPSMQRLALTEIAFVGSYGCCSWQPSGHPLLV
ncbi:hypothetical protein V8C86DRAFT_207775 [Haematococcus lacustris]